MTTETTEKKSISQQVIELLYEKGPMTTKQLGGFIPFEVRRIHTKCLELMNNKHLLEREGEGGPKGKEFIWSLVEGVNPRTLITGEIDAVVAKNDGGKEKPKPDRKAPILEGTPLDQKDMFIKHLVGIGVTPKDAIPSIADMFFSGDIESLSWLNEVLRRGAAGFVLPQQRRFTLSWWGKTRGLPYKEEDYFREDELLEDSKKATHKGKQAEEEEKPKVLDTGQGYRVGKDRQGDWAALPGGPMTYDDALTAAERRALIASYGTPEEEGGEVEEGEEGKPRRKGAKRGEPMVDYLMRKLIDDLVDGKKGGGGESAEVKKLTERIEGMERERLDQRFERIEGLVAQAASRDPWDDYDQIQRMKERLGVGGPTVTDQSPAVQLIKDSTEKMDKNVNRFVGLVERVVLHSDEFKPEENRTSEEREQRAGELLDTARSGDQRRRLRRDTFGM